MNEILLVSNPSRRKKKGRHHGRKSHRYARIRAHRNPSFRGFGGLSLNGAINTAKDGALGALGGVANDVAFGFGSKYLPETLRTGLPRHAVKIGSAVLIGALGGMVLKGKGNALAVGAATTAIYSAAKEYLAVTFPTLPLGEFDQPLLGYDPAQPVGEYMNVGGFQPVGEYMAGDAPTG